jgi:Fe-S-cluster-containing hydrogenase component 2
LRALPDLFGGRVAKYLSPKPKIEKKKCIGCGECARLCPQKTIVMKNQKARIVEKNCIRCWCCQEMCPKKAVKTHSHPIMRFF